MTAAEDSANGLPWGSSRPDVAPEPPPLWRHLKGRIEQAAEVSISLTEFKEDFDFGSGWCGIASKQTHHAYAGGMTSRTVASVWADGPTLAREALAAQLGVTKHVTAEDDDIPHTGAA